VIWKRQGQEFSRMLVSLRSALDKLPAQTLAVIWPDERFPLLEETIPYVLQPPVNSVDLYVRDNLVADNNLRGPALSDWWQETKGALASELAGPPDEEIQIQLLTWEKVSNSLRQTTRRLPRRFLEALITRSLGGPVETVNSIGEDEATKLVGALARSVSEGGCAPVRK